MKPFSFLRNTLRKKEHKSSKAPPAVEPFLLEVAPVSTLSKSGFKETTLLSIDFESTLQAPVPDRLAVKRAEDWESLRSQITPSLRGKHGSLFQSGVHGPPQNRSHGPPIINLGGQSFRPKTPPSRPPRPPSLDLSSRPPSPLPWSPTRVKFAPEPHIRSAQPSSPLRQTFRRQNQTSASGVLDMTPDQIYRDDEKRHCSSRTTFSPSPLAESTSTAHAVLDLSHTPSMKVFNRATSSSPHLPLPKIRPQTEPRTQHSGTLRSSHDTTPSFSPSPPLRIRRRPQPLVLLPTPSMARLPPSPLASSADSTPLATPTLTGPLSSPRSSKFTGRPLRTITPPRHSPPNSPLPTPPASSSFLASPDYGSRSGHRRPLRTVQSTSGLCDQFEAPFQAHRATSSAPSSEVFTAGDEARRRAESTSASDLLEPNERYNKLASDVQIQWGYAL